MDDRKAFDSLPTNAKIYATMMLGVKNAEDAKYLLGVIWQAAAAHLDKRPASGERVLLTCLQGTEAWTKASPAESVSGYRASGYEYAYATIERVLEGESK